MADVRLIDANALKVEMAIDLVLAIQTSEMSKYDMVRCVLDKIDEVSTIDTVKVVRCRDCKHSRPLTKGLVACLRWNRAFICDGFCHDGAKTDAKDMDVPTKDGGAADANSR